MGGAEGDGSSSAHHFQHEGLGVGQVGQVVQHGHPEASDDAIELFLDARLHVRLPQGEDGGPLERRLDRLRSSAEHVADDLLHLAVAVLAVEQLLAASLLFGVLDLQDVAVDDVADVVGVERSLVVIDDLLIEVADFAEILHVERERSDQSRATKNGLEKKSCRAKRMRYLADFVECVIERWQQFENGDETSGGRDGEQFETVVNEVGESNELGVVVAETDGHEQRTDDVGDGRRQVRSQLDGR